MEHSEAVALPFCVVLIQLGDAYLRYLPFRQHMGRDEKTRLRTAFGLWGVASFLLYAAFFHQAGIVAQTYKLALMTGWMPWLVIFMAIVRRDARGHIFIMGMTAIWGFMLHSVAAILVVAAFADLAEAAFLTMHLSLIHI